MFGAVLCQSALLFAKVRNPARASLGTCLEDRERAGCSWLQELLELVTSPLLHFRYSTKDFLVVFSVDSQKQTDEEAETQSSYVPRSHRK